MLKPRITKKNMILIANVYGVNFGCFPKEMNDEHIVKGAFSKENKRCMYQPNVLSLLNLVHRRPFADYV